MAADTDRHWREWGRTDPYYAVLSAEKFRKGNIAQHLDEFFGSGIAHADEALAFLSRHYGDFGRGTALDFGCGVGRVVIGLARHFEKVVGIDISEAMLEEAAANLRKFGIGNTVLKQSDDHLSDITEQYDLVHSYIVFQHIPVRRGMALIAELLRRVRPGGVVALHVSVSRNQSFARRIFYAIRHHAPLARYGTNLILRRPWDEPLVQMNEYDLVAVIELFAASGVGEVSLVAERHGKHSTVMLYGRKSIEGTGFNA